MSEQTLSTLFVGREQELQDFKSVLELDSLSNFLTIHSNGEGGIGKTQLLLRMQAHCDSPPEAVIFNRELIDFYQTESRSRHGVMWQISANLGEANFPKFTQQMQTYQQTQDASERQDVIAHLEAIFRQEYAEFSKTLRWENVLPSF